MTVKIKYDRHGAVKSIKGNVGRTRMNRAALELWKGNIKPTTGYKLRRFLKRLANEISRRAEMAANYYDEESVAAVPYIGLLEDGR